MGIWDLIFIGTPLIGSLILLAGSVYQGIRHKYWLFAIPAVFALAASCGLVSMIIAPGVDETGLICIGAGAWLIFGFLAYVLVRRRKAQPRRVQSVEPIEGEELTSENP